MVFDTEISIKPTTYIRGSFDTSRIYIMWQKDMYLLHVLLCLSITQAVALKLDIQNPHNKKVPFAYTIVERSYFSWHHEMFLISATGLKKSGYYLRYKKSLGCFPIEFCSKHIQLGFQSHNSQFVKHEQGYQWRQQNGTNKIVLVTLLLNWRKDTPFYHFTFG